MRAFAIVIKGHVLSEHGYATLIESSKDVGNDFEIEVFDAITATEAWDITSDPKFKLRWYWPWEGETVDIITGLKMKAYQTANRYARVGCFLSHYNLWKKCVELDEPITILEHDAKFIRKFDVSIVDGMIIGLNDPRGATRKSALYHEMVQNTRMPYSEVPWIDADQSIPQGLAGNSAYVISPLFASQLIAEVNHLGMWPNDALICKQLFPKQVMTVKDYITTIQRLPSTTTL